jgi:Xaa-Pro dipeptidase
MKLCGSRPAFPTIVASGKNIRVPHHEPTIKKAKAPLLIDFGAKYNGYCSDITRTFGSRFENTILKVFDEVEKNLCPGAKASDIDAISRKTMGRYEKFFITGLGHGIGLDVHEKPWVSKNSTDILKEGMVFTIEPGIYVNNGIRIENDYLITKNSFKKITDF